MTNTVAVGEHTLAYLRTGEGPQAVVVIHGIGGYKEDWAGLTAALSATSTVYSIDMLGFGESSKEGETITIVQQAEAVAALLDAEGIEQADLVGNSVGGWVAATFAADNPDRVNRLVLVDAAGFEAMFHGEAPVNFYPSDVAAAENLLAYTRHDPAARTPERAAELVETIAANGDAQAAQAIFQGLYVSERLESVGDRVTVPTLVVWGEEDRLFPTAIADLIVSHIDGSTQVLIPDASHFPQLDNPEAFEAAVVGFLRP